MKPLSEIAVAHFTICLKPWECLYFGGEGTKKSSTPRVEDLCKNPTPYYEWCFNSVSRAFFNSYHHMWFELRQDLWERRKESRNGQYLPDHFYGYCNGTGPRGYIIPMELPFQ
jgi:hypothetical protein